MNLTNMATAKYRRAIEFDDHTKAITGQDLYSRNLKAIPHGKADHHCATTFRIPINEVRARRKSLRYRILKAIGLL